MKTVDAKARIDNLAKLAKQLKKIKRMSVDVGLPVEKTGNDIYSQGKNRVTIAQVGVWNEFGTEKIPKRSFLREPFITKKKEIDSFIGKQYTKIREGGDAEKALNLIGAYCANVSRNAFKTSGDGSWAPLSAATVSKKGSNKPLIDTGTLRNAITWVVKK